jgi:aryl-alcohol dehydrogenase-like predicted oxidoreductase
MPKLPCTDLVVSPIALGTGSLGVAQSEADAHRLLDHFCTLGGNLLDTARIYSDWIPGETGRSERIIGDWLRARPGRRRQVVLATKGLHYDLAAPTRPRVTAAAARQDLESSLRRLGTDVIDLYWLHRDDPTQPAEAIIEFMQVFVREGKVRHLGASNWSAARLAMANRHAARHGLTPFVASQPLFNLGSWSLPAPVDPTMVTLDRAAYDYHCRHACALIPYSSQAHGFFSHPASATTKPAAKRYATEQNLRLAPVVCALARERGCSVNQVILAYLLHQRPTIVPIVGGHSPDQMDDSLGALAVKLTPSQMDTLEDLAGSGIRHATG